VIAIGKKHERKRTVSQGQSEWERLDSNTDATLAVVDPETGLLASPHSVVKFGSILHPYQEVLALPKHTEQIFHARPYKFEQGDPTPMMVEPNFYEQACSEQSSRQDFRAWSVRRPNTTESRMG